jgi:hypothetical protein
MPAARDCVALRSPPAATGAELCVHMNTTREAAVGVGLVTIASVSGPSRTFYLHG